MPAHAFYRFFTGDYLRDAGHLSLLEHGAYRRLIDLYMTTAEPLPFDMPRLYRLLHATSKEEQQAVQVVVEEFFRMDGSVLRHARCDRELQWQRDTSEAARRNVMRREELKKQRLANDRSSGDPSSIIEPEPEPLKELSLSHSVDISATPRVAPACPVEKIAKLWNDIVADAGGQRVENLSKERRARIACRWREVGPDTVEDGLRWFEGLFRTRIAPSKFATGRQPGSDGRIFRIGIDSALRSEQVVDQILEGKYVP